jgi:hypothetical protein
MYNKSHAQRKRVLRKSELLTVAEATYGGLGGEKNLS